jgi:hypothetical protein
VYERRATLNHHIGWGWRLVLIELF